MPSIFSTYSTPENRVTSSILAVLRSLSLDRMQRLVGALFGQSELELISFENQPSKGGEGIPDAMLESSLRLLIETKIKRNTVDLSQINRHLGRLDDPKFSTALLLVLTPDEIQPEILDELNDKRVVWSSFLQLKQAIDDILEDPEEVVSEREAFLLRELKKMLMELGLISSNKDVLVIPARTAWPEYNQFHAYICQPNRSFRPVKRLAFYVKGEICSVVPQILEIHDDVLIKRDEHKGELGEFVNYLLDKKLREEGARYKVLLLSKPEALETLKLKQPIPNNKLDKSGNPTAFVQGQTYVTSKDLLQAKSTSDLKSGD